MSYVPVPATTVLVSPTSSTRDLVERKRSSSVSVGASPVVPVTTIAVGAVVDEMAAERAEAVERDGPVGVERRHDRGEDFAEHRRIVTGSQVRYGLLR